ncbi:MAG TPA: hypothetical protein VHH34_10540 [Pseudonocardiaceae bacterium]|nr:hypothetical protein [Pseudonocardiaceae bacterium]
MGRRPTVSAARPDRDARPAGMLEDFYGAAVPATAWLLETYICDRTVPLRGCGDAQHATVVDLQQAARALGADLTDIRRRLHRLHAAGWLTIDEDGVVDIITP